MNVVGKVSSFITQGVYSVATPFHPFGGAVDIIVVKQQDGTFRSTPWHVRFGKFQGVLKGDEKVVRIKVNGVVADFHMYLDNSGEAYFIREVTAGNASEANGDSRDPASQKGEVNTSDLDNVNSDESLKDGVMSTYENTDSNETDLPSQDDSVTLALDRLDRTNSDGVEDSVELSEYGSSRYENSDNVEDVLESQDSSSEVVVVSVDGHVLKAHISSSERNTEDIKLDTPKFNLGPGQGTDFCDGEFIPTEATWAEDYLSDQERADACIVKNESNTAEHQLDVSEVDGQCKALEKSEPEREHNCSDGSIDHRAVSDEHPEEQNDVPLAAEEAQSGQKEPDEYTECDNVKRLTEALFKVIVTGVEISLCGNLLHAGMGSSAAGETFDANRISEEKFRSSSESIIKNENLVVRIRGNYFLRDRAAPIILGVAECDMKFPVESADAIPVDHKETSKSGGDDTGVSKVPSGRRWTLWPIPFRTTKALERSSCNSSNEEVIADSESSSVNQTTEQTAISEGGKESPHEQIVRTKVPTSDQITSLNLKEGQNLVTFSFSTRVLGEQKVESHIYLWKWNTKIVISDVDGTITKSDVLGQVMPLVGKDWTHFGTARLFSAIKENGYQLLFLSARAIVQAYLTKNFLFNLKQDGKTLPNGPVVISPDGLFPSLYREVIRRAPHEFKIACLEDIKALFPQDHNPFYAGFGNRDTDEFSYRKIGIPKGKIFIINPKGEVSINHQIDVKSYTSLHSLVDDMFPPTSMAEQEDFNSWNYWKMPLADISHL